jgi:hypothetical protein
MKDFDYDNDASWDADYDPEDYPTARRPYHWLTPEQVQSLVEESQLKSFGETKWKS